MRRILRYVTIIGICCLVTVIVTVGVDSMVHGQRKPPDRLGATRIDVEQFQPHTVLGPQPPIVEPPFVNADEAQDEVHPNELVLGVVIDGQARAYPINMLTGPAREIFNDKLAEHSIAATW